MSVGRPAVRSPGFAHEALVYNGEADFLAATVPFVVGGLEAGEPVLVALPRARVALLQSALGRRATEVGWLAMEEIGRNPACIIPAWRDFLDQRPVDGRPVRGIGEPVWAERNPAEYDECHLHEALLNDAFDDAPAFTLLCPYDAAALDASTVTEAHRTHPVVRQGGRRIDSMSYSRAVRDQRFRDPLPEPTASVVEHPIEPAALRGQLRAFRLLIAEHGKRCGLDDPRTADLVLAVDEIVVNAAKHGGGRGVLRLWREDARAVCEVRDNGQFDDAMVGRVQPDHTGTGGRGMWLVNQLCDLVQVRSGPTGTVVRIHVGPDERAAASPT